MNNGGKAEKENTPNEANLQEEEVRSGLVRWWGRKPPAFSKVRGRRGAGLRAGEGAPQSRGWDRPCPETQPRTVAPGGCIFG